MLDRMQIRLREMRDDEFLRWLPKMRESYAAAMVRDGGLGPEAASAKAQRDVDELFPDGARPDEQAVYVIEARGESVGDLWVGEREHDAERVLWVYNLEVAEEHRGRGFGRQAMLFVEDEAQRRGFGHVALNVFGGNQKARDLYRSLGYEERAIAMSKTVDPGSPRSKA
jgi:ribosomal protein S18 acetylase RimI-like enzyme